MTDTFGDYDPDDAWDATDPVVELLRVIAQRIAWVIDHRDDIAARIERIRADVEYIRQRVEDGNL